MAPGRTSRASDLVHLALGGVMMNCGYDPAPTGSTICRRSRPRCGTPIHIAGSSLPWRSSRRCSFAGAQGKGQHLSCAIHEAVAKCTEVDLMSWVMRRALVLRQTCRHARETVSPLPSIVHTKDGRWVMANLGTRPGDVARLIDLLKRYGMEAGLSAESANVPRGTVRTRHRA